MTENEVTEAIIGGAIEVHKTFGPGLLESIYEECLAVELEIRQLRVVRQFPVPLQYKGRRVGMDLKIDLLVEDHIVVELKAVERLLPIHEAQLLTYLRLTNKPIGLLINFNVPLLKEGVRRLITRPLRASVPLW